MGTTLLVNNLANDLTLTIAIIAALGWIHSMRSYLSEKGKLEAQKEYEAKRQAIILESNKQLEQEKKKLLEELDSIRNSYNIELEKIKKHHSIELEEVKHNHQLDITKRKYRYDSKKTEFQNFANLLDSIAKTDVAYLFGELRNYMLNFYEAHQNKNQDAINEATRAFNQKASDFVESYNKNLATLYSQSNGIRLVSKETADKIDDLLQAIAKAKIKIESIITLIGHPSFNMHSDLSQIVAPSQKDDGRIFEIKQELIALMRLELEKF